MIDFLKECLMMIALVAFVVGASRLLKHFVF